MFKFEKTGNVKTYKKFPRLSLSRKLRTSVFFKESKVMKEEAFTIATIVDNIILKPTEQTKHQKFVKIFNSLFHLL